MHRINARRARPMTVRRNALSLAIAAAIPTLVLAQDENQLPVVSEDEKAVMEEVVVTSTYRQALIDSIETKRSSTSIVEAISAEDIAKLPDSSIAESIARLPGLAAQRLDGRASSVSVRGLGEDFSTATVNGREQVSIGDNRGIEFDLYPSEIVTGVTVHKTPDATLTTQGIGGTINLHTARPLEMAKTVHLGVTYEQNGHDQLNPDGEDTGYRGSFSYIDQFADDTVGFALSVATMDSPNQEERWNSWGFPTTSEGDLVLGGAKPFVRSSTLDRDTVMGVLQFEPNDRMSITADALYIDFKDEKILRGIELPGAWAQPTEVISVDDGLVTQGIWEGVRGQVRNDFETREAELFSIGANVKYDVNERWRIEFDASRGDVSRNIWSLESYSGFGRASDPTAPADDIGYSLNNANAEGAVFSPSLNYGDPGLIRLGGQQFWGNNVTVPSDAQDGFINFPEVDDELTTLELSANAETGGFFSGLDFGIYYSDRKKSKVDEGLFLTLPSYPDVSAIPSQYMLPNTSLEFIGMGTMVSYDSFAFWQDGNYIETPESLTTAGRSTNTWTVNEEVTIGYVKADFDTLVGNTNIYGNIGVQLVDTDQSSDGFAVSTVDGFVVSQPVSGGDSYSELLPSANIIIAPNDEHKFRLGAARTMSRSRMDRMNASFGYSFNPAFNTPNANIDSSPWSGSGANPELRPQMADQFDVAWEYYFGDAGYVAAAYFYKDLKDWQVNVGEVVDFTGITPPGGQVATFNQGIVSRWENGEGGTVDGFELQGALPGGMLADALDGFGLVGSATFLSSSVEIGGSEIDVPGLSDEVYNLTLYYEKSGWQFRVSGSWRSEFLGEVNAISFSRELVTVKDTEIWDAQLSYDFSESNIDWLQGFTATLQAQNLTNEPFVTFNNSDERQVRDFQDYGRNYLLGISYRF